VELGESLAPGVLASAAGEIVAIAPHPLIHPSGREVNCVRIATDSPGVATRTFDDTLVPTLPALRSPSLERLVAAGVTGLGGAGFATADKLLEARALRVHTLLVNGAECEPGIACDEALMEVAAEEIVAGALELAGLVGCRRTLVAIESDKRTAGAAMAAVIDRRAWAGATIEHVEVAPLYPSGAERLLVALACGVRVPGNERPTAHGVLCINVATARAAHRARLGEPQLTRVVTVGGTRSASPCNVRVAFGTPVAHVLATSAQGPRAADTRVRAGGPLSGFDLASTAVPITATTNRIALEPPRQNPSPAPCIRCAACSDVCPVALLPQELLRHARAEDDDALARGGLDACIECGCCDIVCPSAIPLTATFRHARAALADTRTRARDAALAESRYRRREERLTRRASERERSHARVLAEAATGAHEATDTDTDPVAAALARARRRRGT